MRRLILSWIRGNKQVKHSAIQISQISDRLIKIFFFIPDHLSRKPRSLQKVDRWKATEFRQFLLYTEKNALKDILRRDLYDHFLTLNIAITILVNPFAVRKHKDYAHKLLQYFVTTCHDLYGKEYIVYNIHSLVYLTADAHLYGSLDNCSAFPF